MSKFICLKVLQIGVRFDPKSISRIGNLRQRCNPESAESDLIIPSTGVNISYNFPFAWRPTIEEALLSFASRQRLVLASISHPWSICKNIRGPDYALYMRIQSDELRKLQSLLLKHLDTAPQISTSLVKLSRPANRSFYPRVSLGLLSHERAQHMAKELRFYKRDVMIDAFRLKERVVIHRKDDLCQVSRKPAIEEGLLLSDIPDVSPIVTFPFLDPATLGSVPECKTGPNHSEATSKDEITHSTGNLRFISNSSKV